MPKTAMKEPKRADATRSVRGKDAPKRAGGVRELDAKPAAKAQKLREPEQWTSSLMTPDYFRKATGRSYEKLGVGSSKHLAKVESMLKQFHKEQTEVTDLATSHSLQVDYVKEIAQFCAKWLEWHNEPDDKRRDVVKTLGEQAASETTRLNTLFKATYGDDHVGRTEEEVEESYTGITVSSAFEKLAGLIQRSLTGVGSRFEHELNVEIPVATEGTFVGFTGKLSGSMGAEDQVMIRVELGVTGGSKVYEFAKIKGVLGGYVEAQGRDATEALRLLSYGLMRKARESSLVPAGFTNLAWGADSGQKGFKRAEMFSTSVEEAMRGRGGDSYVEVGAMAAAKAQVQLGVAELEATAQGGVGKRWDETGIEAIGARKGAWDKPKIEAISGAILRAQGNHKTTKSLQKELAAAGHEVEADDLKKITKSLKPTGGKKRASSEEVTAAVSGFSDGRRAFTGLGEEAETAAEAARPRGENVADGRLSAKGKIAGIGSGGGSFSVQYTSEGRDSAIGKHWRQAKFEARAGLEIPGAGDGGVEFIKAKTYGLLKWLGEMATKHYGNAPKEDAAGQKGAGAKSKSALQQGGESALAELGTQIAGFSEKVGGALTGDLGPLAAAAAAKAKTTVIDAAKDKIFGTTCELVVQLTALPGGQFRVALDIVEVNEASGSLNYLSARTMTSERLYHKEWIKGGAAAAADASGT